MVDRAASAIVAALESCWDALKHDTPDLPYEVIVLAGRGRRPVHGYCEPGRWTVDGAGVARAEILIAGESLVRGPIPTFGTLIHEATHALAIARGIKDTSRQNRYHNKRFKELANSLGITVEYSGSIGWSLTTVPDETVRRYRRPVDVLTAALKMVRKADAPVTRTKTSAAVTCGCITLRGSGSAVAEWLSGITICGKCGQPFARKDQET